MFNFVVWIFCGDTYAAQEFTAFVIGLAFAGAYGVALAWAICKAVEWSERARMGDLRMWILVGGNGHRKTCRNT